MPRLWGSRAAREVLLPRCPVVAAVCKNPVCPQSSLLSVGFPSKSSAVGLGCPWMWGSSRKCTSCAILTKM